MWDVHHGVSAISVLAQGWVPCWQAGRGLPIDSGSLEPGSEPGPSTQKDSGDGRHGVVGECGEPGLGPAFGSRDEPSGSSGPDAI